MSDSQKFIARNRAPRVQIEYDVELYGAEKKVQLPFVMGVVSDLAGKSKVSQPAIDDRKFLEIDVDTFDDRMKAMAPRAAFTVPNTLTGEGNLPVDLTFESMEDFTPAAIARNIDVLRPLLEAREQLSNLMTYMDGKAGAEALIEDILSKPEVLKSLSGGARVAASTDATLDTLRAAAPPETSQADEATDVLAAMQRIEKVAEADTSADILAGIDQVKEAPSVSTATDVLAAIEPEQERPEADTTADILAEIEQVETPENMSETADDILAGLDTATDEPDDQDDLNDVLNTIEAAPEAEVQDDTDDVLAGLDAPTPQATDDMADVLAGIEAAPEEAETDDLKDILSDVETVQDADTQDETDDILAGLDAPDVADADGDDLDDILAEIEPEVADEDSDDVDVLLADLETPEEEDAGGDDLDDVLAGLDTDDPDADDDIDALLADLDDDDADTDDDLDTQPRDTEDEANATGETDTADTTPPPPVQSPFGTISVPRPARANLNRTKFRMALFGDFTGRAARGVLETGDALAARAPIVLDVDTVDDVIESFGTTLVLPIGAGGTGVEIKLSEMDDLHPDALYENVALFEAIAGVRQQLDVGSMAERAVEQLTSWSQTYATPIKLPKRSAGTAMPTHLKLTDFQALIGDTRGTLSETGAADALIAQVIGPHVVKAPDAGAAAMKAAVDEALGSAMNLILHHPEFQAIEAQWRSLDLLARRIETDVTLDIVLYDVSAEELAADLAAHEDLAESGLFKLATDVLDPEDGAGGFSAMFGLYTFEETPPHAELLARIGTVAAHVDAPFFAAISPNYLDTAPQDRHPLVAESWDTLRSLPEAAYLALAAPRFLLRQPYGAKSDPVYAFKFEEFSPRTGLKSMLWANPAVLIAILLAGTHKKDGKAMDLGSLMALGDLPFFYVNDQHGDQVALPCTERNLTTDPAQATLQRGYMPVVWMKGRNEIRLGSFRSLGGDTIAGPWEAEVPAPRKTPGTSTPEAEIPSTDVDEDDEDDTSLDDLMSDLEDDASQDDDDGGLDDLLADLDDDDDDDDDGLDDLLAGLDDDDDDDDDTSLDDLLAGFDDDDDASDDDDEMDSDLAALLEGL